MSEELNLKEGTTSDYPLVSIIWVNYNSSKIMNIVKLSLLSIKKLHYKNYGLIVIDNASTDGSFEEIVSYLKEIGLNAKIIRNKRNLGFTGGNNVGYLARDPRAKYLVLLNNDTIVYPDSLTRMVKAMEKDLHCGALQGIILWLGKDSVYSAGALLDEFMFSNIILRNEKIKLLNEEHFITYSEGFYSIYRIDVLKKLGDYPFIWAMFLYFDDSILGIKLWNRINLKMHPLYYSETFVERYISSC
jgi:Predicted glycosyltransferases